MFQMLYSNYRNVFHVRNLLQFAKSVKISEFTRHCGSYKNTRGVEKSIDRMDLKKVVGVLQNFAPTSYGK